MKEKITVLIADDNSEFSATLAGYINAEEDLELVGMATDGVDAFDMIKNLEPDIVLLDVIMPRLDGLGVLERLEENNIEVRSQDVEVGNTYPIYGMITKFLDQKDDCLEVEINFSIKAKMVVPEADNVEILKRRSFEPGIFISEILSKDEGLEVKCNTVVFGKQKEQELN